MSGCAWLGVLMLVVSQGRERLMVGASSAGWGAAASRTETWIAGAELFGDTVLSGMAGVSCPTSGSQELCFPHYRSSERWYTGIALVNPDPDRSASVRLTAYGDAGSVLARATRSIPPRCSMAELSDSLFGVEGQGWVWVESDQPILGLEIYGDRLHGGLASLTACQVARSLAAPHVVQGSSWWSGIALANPGEKELNITLTLREHNGEMGSQWQGIIPGHGRVVGLIETLFPKISSCNGWIDVSASGELAGMLTLGYEKEGIQTDLAATELMEANEILRLPVLLSDDTWWTGVAITNPHRATAYVDLKTYSEEGEIVGSRQTTIGPEQKVSGLVSSLLAVPVRGWLEVKSDVPLAGMEMLCLQQGPGSGLVALSGATPHEEIFFPHLSLSDRWWTQLSLCHPLSSVSCQGVLGVVESDGVVLGCRTFDLDKKCATFQDARILMGGK